MNMNMNDSRPRNMAQKAKDFGIAATVAFAGFVLGVAAHEKADQKWSGLESQRATNERLMQAARDNYLVHMLGKGNIDDLRQELDFELAGILLELHLTASDLADPVQQAYMDSFCLHILRDETQHPEYFQTASTKAKLQEENVWAALKQELSACTAVPVPSQAKTALPSATEKN